jgi:hypothetical protein
MLPDMDLGPIEALDLTEPCEMSGAVSDAGVRLLTYMAWPDDEIRRKQFLATLAAEAIGELQSLPPPGFGATFRQHMIELMLEKHFHPHGGFSAVAAAPGLDALRSEIASKTPGWCAAGQLLFTIRCIAEFHADIRGGASVKKAVELMTRFVAGKDAIKDRTRIMAIWARFKPVAHLCAAYTEAAAIALKYGGTVRQEILDGATFFSGLGRTLAVARDYQAFMTAFTPQGQKAPLIGPDLVWRVPGRLRLREMSGNISRLPDAMAAALREYRAPKQI